MGVNKYSKCGCFIKPVNGMTPETHLSKAILNTYRYIQEEYIGELPLPCPRCGKAINPDHDGNATSRHEDIYICDECCIDETERDAKNDELAVTKWHISSMILNCIK